MANELLMKPEDIYMDETTTVTAEAFRFNDERSPSIGKLAVALSAAQGEMPPAVKDSTNPHFRSNYAGLASMWVACRAPLAKHGLAVLQPVSAEGPKVTVRTILAHSSGEWISGALTIQAQQNTPQAIGSAITYGRRYGLAAMVGIAPDDDDGESAEGRGSQPQPARRPEPEPDNPIITATKEFLERVQSPAPVQTREARISEAQAKRFYAIAKGAGWADADLQAWLNEVWSFTKSADITRNKYDAICDEARKGPVAVR